jgi:hypothetical protein
MANYHTDAGEMLIEAAKRCGLFDEIAEFIAFAHTQPSPVHCPMCLLLDDFAEAFDVLVYTPSRLSENLFGTVPPTKQETDAPAAPAQHKEEQENG